MIGILLKITFCYWFYQKVTTNEKDYNIDCGLILLFTYVLYILQFVLLSCEENDNNIGPFHGSRLGTLFSTFEGYSMKFLWPMDTIDDSGWNRWIEYYFQNIRCWQFKKDEKILKNWNVLFDCEQNNNNIEKRNPHV